MSLTRHYPRFKWGHVIPGSPFDKRIKYEEQRNAGTQHPAPIRIVRSQGVDRIERLLYGGHSTQQLTQTLKNFLGRRGVSTPQAAAIHQFHLATVALQHNPYQKLEGDSIIREYYSMFNDIFFYGSLKDYVHVEVEQFDEEIFSECYGHCASPSDPPEYRQEIPDNFAASIVIKSLLGDEFFPFRNARLAHYLGTLLHEMLHAYFGIYLCNCSRECRKSGKVTGTGTTGHGKLWFEAALAIEQATLPLLGVSLELGLSDTIYHEYGKQYKTTAPQDLLLALEPMAPEEPDWAKFLDMEKLQ